MKNLTEKIVTFLFVQYQHLKKFLGTIYGTYCSKCGGELRTRGYHEEKSYCPYC